MFKSIQIKLLLIIIVLAVIMIAGIQYFFISQMNQIKANSEEITSQIKTARTVTVVVLTVFIAISSIIILFVSRRIISPISKLIKNAKKISEGEEIEIKYKGDDRTKTEIDELVKAFGVVTNRIKRKLE